MLKKILYTGIFAVVCLALVAVILLQRLGEDAPLESIRVPEDAILFIEDLDYDYLSENFLPGNRMWVDFIHTSGRNKMDSSLRVLLDRISEEEGLQDLLSREGVSFSIHLVGKDLLQPLFYLSFAERYSSGDFEDEMCTLLGEEARISERKYETERLSEVSGAMGDLVGDFSYACVKGILLVSPSAMLVESAIRTIHSEPDTARGKVLQKIRSTAGRFVHANIYINYERLEKLFYPMLDQKHWPELAMLGRLASYGELDLDIKEDALLFNGMTHAGEIEGHFLSSLRAQSPVKMELHEVMPAGTYRFMHLGISDPAAFLEDLARYYGSLEKWAAMEEVLSAVKREYGVDLLGDLLLMLDDELAVFSMDDGSPSRQEKLLILETGSGSESQELCSNWVEAYLRQHRGDMDSYQRVYELDPQTRYTMYRMPDYDSKGVFPAGLFRGWFTIYENYLIFAPTVDLLSRVIYQNVLHKTFASDPVYKEVSDYFSNRSNLSYFLRPYPTVEVEKEVLSSTSRGSLASLELFLRRIPGVVMQYSTEGDLLYHGAALCYTSQIREKALTVWESMLDSMAGIKPALVLNHNTREKEIFVQDKANRIYLVNGTGRILWKQQLEGPILGAVRQVDYYKNAKLQLLFNTAEKIYLIDRNGNPVERYPLSLTSKATAPLGLFDYDKSRDYRICIPCEDRRLRLYDLEGKQLEGWKFGKSESHVTTAPRHFRIKDKDYIVFKDGTRAYFLDRRGKQRIKLSKRVVFSANSDFELDMNIQGSSPRWMCTDTSGSVVAVSLDGQVSTLLEQELSASHYFRMSDIDADGVSDFLFADGDELSLLKQDGTRLYSYKVKGHIGALPDIYKFSSSDIKIGICDTGRNRIYLLNADGSLYEGFPLEGGTRFSIGYFAGSDSRFNLIVGGDNSFLYNYSIK